MTYDDDPEGPAGSAVSGDRAMAAAAERAKATAARNIPAFDDLPEPLRTALTVGRPRSAPDR